MNNDFFIKAHDIHVSFKHNHVLKGINLILNRGEKTIIIGKNGAGKTVLAEVLASLIKPNKGKVYYNFQKKGTFSNSIGMQFQDSDYPAGIRVKDLYRFFCRLYGKQIDKKQLKILKEMFDYKNLRKREISQLSGGQKQKINLMLSIIHTPEFLILDEISTGLDVDTAKKTINFIVEIQKKFNITMLVVSHNVLEIDTLADRVLHLKEGEIIADKTKDEIIEKYGNMNAFLLEEI